MLADLRYGTRILRRRPAITLMGLVAALPSAVRALRTDPARVLRLE